MKSILSVSMLAVLLLFSCKPVEKSSSSSEKTVQEQYLSSVTNGTYFGMTEEAFKKEYRSGLFISDEIDFRTQITEPIGKDQIKEIIYYFSTGGNDPLYECIVEYEPTADVKSIARKAFGTPNVEGKEWLHRSAQGYLVKSWVFKNKIVVAAAIKGTGFEKSWTLEEYKLKH